MLSFPALIGSVIFLAALGMGVTATYLNVKRAQGPRERTFVLRISLMCWALLLTLLASAYFLRPPWLYLVMFGYFVVCPILVYRWSTKHQLLRVVERREEQE